MNRRGRSCPAWFDSYAWSAITLRLLKHAELVSSSCGDWFNAGAYCVSIFRGLPVLSVIRLSNRTADRRDRQGAWRCESEPRPHGRGKRSAKVRAAVARLSARGLPVISAGPVLALEMLGEQLRLDGFEGGRQLQRHQRHMRDA